MVFPAPHGPTSRMVSPLLPLNCSRIPRMVNHRLASGSILIIESMIASVLLRSPTMTRRTAKAIKMVKAWGCCSASATSTVAILRSRWIETLLANAIKVVCKICLQRNVRNLVNMWTALQCCLASALSLKIFDQVQVLKDNRQAGCCTAKKKEKKYCTLQEKPARILYPAPPASAPTQGTRDRGRGARFLGPHIGLF